MTSEPIGIEMIHAMIIQAFDPDIAIPKTITLKNIRDIQDRVYEIVAQKLENEPGYQQDHNDIYGLAKRYLRILKCVLKSNEKY